MANGAIIVFLAPYSPIDNPIEYAFSVFKAFWRRHSDWLSTMGTYDAARLCLFSIPRISDLRCRFLMSIFFSYLESEIQLPTTSSSFYTPSRGDLRSAPDEELLEVGLT